MIVRSIQQNKSRDSFPFKVKQVGKTLGNDTSSLAYRPGSNVYLGPEVWLKATESADETTGQSTTKAENDAIDNVPSTNPFSVSDFTKVSAKIGTGATKAGGIVVVGQVVANMPTQELLGLVQKNNYLGVSQSSLENFVTEVKAVADHNIGKIVVVSAAAGAFTYYVLDAISPNMVWWKALLITGSVFLATLILLLILLSKGVIGNQPSESTINSSSNNRVNSDGIKRRLLSLTSIYAAGYAKR